MTNQKITVPSMSVSIAQRALARKSQRHMKPLWCEIESVGRHGGPQI